MPDTNLVRSLTYLMDCFLDEYRDVKVAQDIDELDLRAQLEVRLDRVYIYVCTCLLFLKK